MGRDGEMWGEMGRDGERWAACGEQTPCLRAGRRGLVRWTPSTAWRRGGTSAAGCSGVRSNTAGARVRPRGLVGVRECVFRFYGLEPGVESAARVEEVVHVPVAAEIRGDMGRYAEICGDPGRYGEIWGDMGRYGEIWGDPGRPGEIWGGPGRSGETRGDMGRSGEIRGDMGRSGEVCHPCGLVRSL